MDRPMADNAGMLATLINALALQDALERLHGIDTRTQSAPSTSRKLPSPSYGEGPFGTLKRGVSSSSPPVPATRT